MKAKTKKSTTNSTSKAFAVGTHEGQVFASVPYTLEDFKNSLLIVSLLVNFAVLILWLMTQVDTAYAYQVALILLGQ